MVVIGKKKYESGEGAQFITRKRALKKLQLSLNDFRKLCILKGVYPREPRNRKRAQKGQSGIKTLYHIKDIQFLMHEPIIWKMREYKIFNKKVGRAKALKDFAAMKRYLSNHPTLKLDHIVKERYPTFIDALRDLDDCLTLCFLFSTFPSMTHVPRDQSLLCRRLTVEFMHAIIAAGALRKVFVSIKGYYYQAEIKGQTITWIVPHHFCFEPQSKAEVDFKVMSTFVEFYIVMLGFVNFRLYHSLNLYYPPNLNHSGNSEKSLVDEETYVAERIAALNVPLINLDPSAPTGQEDDLEIDEFTNTDASEMEEAKLEMSRVKKLKTLFKGLKVFVNREVPREPLVFVLRCFGAQVSWDKMLYVGATFDENDETITHQIVDRPSMDKQYISRYYVQPQWVFDSVNARELLPVEKYLMGCPLPPHLSPFTNSRLDQTYMPPEERALVDPDFKMPSADQENTESDSETEEEAAADAEMEEEVDAEESSNHEESEPEVETSEITTEEPENEKESERLKKKKAMKVKTGEISKADPWEKNRQEQQEYRLRVKMIKKKHRNLYKSMMKGREDRAKEIWLLRKKRRLHEAEEKTKLKESRKAAKKQKQSGE